MSVQPLFQDSLEEVRLEEWAPAARVDLSAPGRLELLVLAGSFEEGASALAHNPGCDCRLARRSMDLTGAAGCRVWAKSGHLNRIRLPPEIAT